MSPWIWITPGMGAMACRSTATIFTSSADFPSALLGRNLRDRTWLQLPGAAHRSTTFFTWKAVHNIEYHNLSVYQSSSRPITLSINKAIGPLKQSGHQSNRAIKAIRPTKQSSQQSNPTSVAVSPKGLWPSKVIGHRSNQPSKQSPIEAIGHRSFHFQNNQPSVQLAIKEDGHQSNRSAKPSAFKTIGYQSNQPSR